MASSSSRKDLRLSLGPRPVAGVNSGVLIWLKAFGRMEGSVVSILPGH